MKRASYKYLHRTSLDDKNPNFLKRQSLVNLQNFSAFDAKTKRHYTERIVQNDTITSYRAEKALKGARDFMDSLAGLRQTSM